MMRGFGCIPRYLGHEPPVHRTLHRLAVLSAAHANDVARRAEQREVERMLDDVDAAIRAGMNEAPEQRVLRESGEWSVLAEPEYWTDWRREHAA